MSNQHKGYNTIDSSSLGPPSGTSDGKEWPGGYNDQLHLTLLRGPGEIAGYTPIWLPA